MIQDVLTIILLLASLTGCNVLTQSDLPEASEYLGVGKALKFDELVKFASEKHSHVVHEIERFLNNIEPCSEKIDPGAWWCEIVKVPFTAKSATAKSHGQRILIIDDGMHYDAYTRYKSRVLDSLTPDESGNYRSHEADVRIAKGKLEILSHILDECYPDTPGIALQAIRERMKRQVLFPVTEIPNHGDRIFRTLADLNPKSEFVIAGLWPLPVSRMCVEGTGPGALSFLANYLDHVASSLIGVIRTHDVNFVNMSFGHTLGDTTNQLSTCVDLAFQLDTHAKDVLELIKTRFYEPLFALKDVVFVQAGPWSNNRLAEGDPRFSIDCVSYKNRIRVGYVEKLATDVPPNGARREEYIGSIGARGCIDVFFNTGVVLDNEEQVVRGDYPYLTPRWGIGTSHPASSFAASWAAPFVLSYLNFLKQDAVSKGKEFTYSELINSQKTLDPFQYGQFELFRTGGLK